MTGRATSPARVYDEETVTLGLTKLALCGGNTAEAARRLNAAGVSISRSVLEKWKNRTQVDRYERIRDQQAGAIQKRVAARCEDLAVRESQLAHQMLDRLEEIYPEMAARDLAGAIRNLEVSKAVNVDKTMILRERPTQIVEHRDHNEIIRALEALGVAKAVDSTAEEIEGVGA